MLLIQRIFGALYLAAGVAKAFPQIEDVGEVLALAAEANKGTWYEGLSVWFAANSDLMNVLVGIALAGSGLVLLVNRGPVKAVIYAQIAMMACFVTLLHRSAPQVIALDAVFFIAAILMLRYQYQRDDQQKQIPDASQFSAKGFESVGRSTNPLDNFDSHYDVVIIGGGASGLSAAWELKDKKVLLLEKHPVFGGNARHESDQGLRHATAGVCFQQPVAGTAMSQLLKDVGLWQQWKVSDDDTIVFFDTSLLMSSLPEICIALFKRPKYLLIPAMWGLTGNLLLNWITGTRYTLAAKKLGDPIFADLYEFLDRFGPESGKYPAMPWNKDCGWTREDMEALDSLSLYEYLFEPSAIANLPEHLKPGRRFGRLVHDAIDTTLRVECLTLNDVSAYVGLHFLIGYLRGTLVTLPGGNGSVTARLVEKLKDFSTVQLANEITVKQVESTTDKTQVRFYQSGELNEVTAGAVIWAAPKHTIGNTVAGLSAEQRQAMAQIEHHDYCVGNVFLNQSELEQYFGGYVIEPWKDDAHLEWCKTGVCLVPHWTDDQYHRDHGIFTLLKPIAKDDDQDKLAQADPEDIRQKTLEEITTILNAAGVSPSVINDLKIWRWPKALVVAKRGQVRDNVFVNASAPVNNIYFANQDSVGIGNIESAVHAGMTAAHQIRVQVFNQKPELNGKAKSISTDSHSSNQAIV